jgi:hypothetical protein
MNKRAAALATIHDDTHINNDRKRKETRTECLTQIKNEHNMYSSMLQVHRPLLLRTTHNLAGRQGHPSPGSKAADSKCYLARALQLEEKRPAGWFSRYRSPHCL